MKTFITFLFPIIFSCFVYGQENNFLESKQGFRNIKLGTTVDSYLEFSLKSESNMELFKLSMNPKTTHVYQGNDNDKIKTAKILFIYLITEKNIITEIRVVTQKVLNVYSILENAYGKPTDKQGTKLIWRTSTIECSIEGDSLEIPGYHISYRMIPENRKLMNARMEKAKLEAQAEL